MSDILLVIRAYVNALVGTHIKSERGATAVEYALIVAGIAVVIVGAVFALGGKIEERLHERPPVR